MHGRSISRRSLIQATAVGAGALALGEVAFGSSPAQAATFYKGADISWAQQMLKAGIALAPFSPSQNMAGDHVPTLVFGGQRDTTVTPSYLSGLYKTPPAATPSAFAQIAGADHGYYTHPNNVQMKLIIPWLKIFVDADTRYVQFLCPKLPDPSTISIYQSKCPYTPR